MHRCICLMPLADNMRQYGNTETMGDYMPASAEHSLKKRTIWEPMGDNTEKMAGTVLKMRSQSETTGDNTGISTDCSQGVLSKRDSDRQMEYPHNETIRSPRRYLPSKNPQQISCLCNVCDYSNCVAYHRFVIICPLWSESKCN